MLHAEGTPRIVDVGSRTTDRIPIDSVLERFIESRGVGTALDRGFSFNDGRSVRVPSAAIPNTY